MRKNLFIYKIGKEKRNELIKEGVKGLSYKETLTLIWWDFFDIKRLNEFLLQIHYGKHSKFAFRDTKKLNKEDIQ